MEWLNYHHLHYFWVIAHQGSIAKACQVLRLAQPTLSAQLKALEEQLGQPLFERRQRRLILTSTGRVVLTYADRIFQLGQELMDTVAERPTGGPQLLNVGVVDAVPKPVSFALVRRLLDEEPLVRVTVHEGRLQGMLQELNENRLDLILSDVAASNEPAQPTMSRPLGRMAVGLVCSAAWRHLKRDLPSSLQDAPLALPTLHSPLRHEVDDWLSRQGVQLRVLAEFQDTELLKRFALEGMGLAPLNLRAVSAELESGALIQLGPELAQEQLWMVVSPRATLSPLAEWLWKKYALEDEGEL
ncbi:MAG: LysR substrate-binding domain-containing protein [Myxococcota bacterium]